MSSPAGNNLNLIETNVDITAGVLNDALQRIENIGKDLLFLIEHIEYLGRNEYLMGEMSAILNHAEELDNKLSTIVESAESSLSGED